MKEHISETVHASAVAINGVGVLISGPSGSGKSDLALRLIDRGAVLVGDDGLVLSNITGGIMISCPASIAGKIEVRSLGILTFDHLGDVALKMQVNLVNKVDRFPMDSQKETILGHLVDTITLDPFETSAPIKVELGLQRILEKSEQS